MVVFLNSGVDGPTTGRRWEVMQMKANNEWTVVDELIEGAQRVRVDLRKCIEVRPVPNLVLAVYHLKSTSP